MQLIFTKVTLHNFLSYGHTELYLRDKNYCLVSGINNNPKDNATSNGAGKSSWTSAICWALTGETISGLKTNIKNINVEENSCWVELEFSADNNNFIVTRYKNPKSDLKILMNGNDISGKGIKESEIVLAKYLPDLTSQLISSIVILGQGLPNKFTSNSPSGRKEVLEKLSKSDFMIQDLKDRIATRSSILANELRQVEDKLLVNSSNKNIYNDQLVSKRNELSALEQPQTFDDDIDQTQKNITDLIAVVDTNTANINSLNQQINNLTAKYSELLNNKDVEMSEENTAWKEFETLYMSKKFAQEADIKTKSAEIVRLKAIKDVCPTCGQKLPNVLKPDTTTQEAELEKLKSSLAVIKDKYNENLSIHNEKVKQITDKYKVSLLDLNNSINQLQSERGTTEKIIKDKQSLIQQLQTKITKIQYEKANYENTLNTTKLAITDFEQKLQNIDAEILYNNNIKIDIDKHIKVVNQMNNLIKRDFRGYLLKNIIEYISKRAKEYCMDVFGNDLLEFSLDGNNIDISYANKSYENLSGGEKQKCDIIIQFAIREMMQSYLGFSSNILVLDEITDALDVCGCNNVLNLLTKRLTDIESIFIISHRAKELAIPCDSEIIVTKNEQGISSILCY